MEFPAPDQIINILFGALKQLCCFGGSDNPLLDKSHEILLRQGDNFASLIKCAVRDSELIPPANAISTYQDADLVKIVIVFQQRREDIVRSEYGLQLTAFNQTVAEKTSRDFPARGMTSSTLYWRRSKNSLGRSPGDISLI